jgi:hypothetical protein
MIDEWWDFLKIVLMTVVGYAIGYWVKISQEKK